MIQEIQQKTGASLRQICDTLDMPRSSFYQAAKPTSTQVADEQIGAHVAEIFVKHRRRYGARRIAKELDSKGIVCAQGRVGRLMKEQGLVAIEPKTFVPKTSDGRADAPSKNLLEDRPAPQKIDEVWCGYITFIPCRKGWLYLAFVIDLCSRKVVGRSLDFHMKATSSKQGDRRFKQVEEMASAILHFPGDRVAQFTCSFGSGNVSSLELVGTKGMLPIEPAYDYVGELAWSLTVDEKKKEKTFPAGDQFAPELMHFSNCVLKGQRPEPDGEEGLADVRIVDAIFKSAASGRAVKITPVKPQKRIDPSQAVQRPTSRTRPLVRTEAPHSL